MINVTKSYLPSREKYDQYVDKIYKSGWLTNNGQFVQELTQRLESYLGVKNLLLVTNATIGLQIAYQALGLTGEVITTPFSFVATTSSLVWEGLTPVFADIDPETYCMNPDKIKNKITQNTSAILPVHVYGNVCEVEKIQKMAHEHKLKIVYDAAHSFGVDYKDKSVLQYGDVSVLSFHATKLFHTIEGGALIIKDEEIFKKAQKMLNFGFESNGEPKNIGINGKISEFHAAMGLCVLEDMEHILRERKRVDAYYRKNLRADLRTLNINKDATSNYAYFPVVFSSEDQLLKIVTALKENNIHPRRYFYPALNTVSYVDQTTMPIAEDISKRVLCLPIYPELSDGDLHRICSIIRQERV